jgi:23S rRNA pseudouridine2457 synthase
MNGRARKTPRPESAFMLIAFNKPFGVLSQFTANDSPPRALADFAFPKQVYPSPTRIQRGCRC